MTIEQKVLSVIKSQFGVDEIDANSNFKDLDVDSLDAVELIMAFEDAFNIEISDEIAQGITSVQSAVDAITALVK
jgi:acyl carrier protein